jgi:ABC-type transport system involved in cytochrome c biogenesis permease subunit
MFSPESIVQFSAIGGTACLGVATLASAFGKRQSATTGLLLFFLLCILFFGTRAYLKDFFPFTDKVESFMTLSVLIALCGMLYRDQVSNKEFTALLVLSFAAAITTFVFEDRIKFPTAYLRTIWYPMHVPFSFAAYAFWFLAAVDSIFASRLYRNLDPSVTEKQKPLVTNLNRNGFIFFTLAMLFGGIWGYLAWGAYFMWDPKLLWSVILWLYYGNLLHIDSLPRFRRWKAPLYSLGFVLIMITFVGTGFFTRSIHRF